MWSGHTRKKKERAAKAKMERCICKSNMTEAGQKEDKTTNRAAWRNKIISYTGDPMQMTGQARDEEEDEYCRHNTMANDLEGC